MADDHSASPDLMDMAEAERSDLAAFLGTLSRDQWAAPTLCEQWTVKDVVSHVISYDTLSTSQLIARLVRGYFVRSNQIGVDELKSLDETELLNLLNRHLRPSGLTAGFGGMIGLVDGTIHQQDIRRALGQPRSIPSERLHAVLDAVPSNPRLGAWRRIRGLRLTATDIDWHHGVGDEVAGTGEALLMAITGRSSAVSELTGPGRTALASRL